MYEELKNDREKLSTFVRKSNADELSKMVRGKICSTDAPKMLDDILQAFSDSEACQLKRRKLVESTLKVLSKVKVTTGHSDAIINRIILDFPKYSKQHLVKLIDFCVTEIRENDNENHLNSWKDLVPVLLEALENEKYINYLDAEISGKELKTKIVQTICNTHWDVDLLPSLAKMFGDMPLEKADRTEALKGLCRALTNLPMDQVPPFVYQTLKLCKHQNSKYLLQSLRVYFDAHYSQAIANENTDSADDIGVVSIKEMRDVESTVLYHVYQAAQLNHENMKDFIQYLKGVSCASEHTLKPFVLAVLLTISSIYEDQVFEILKSAIISNTQDEEKRKNSAWLRQLLPPPCNVNHLIGDVIDNSNKDRHLVLQGLIRLAFTLMSMDQKSKGSMTSLWEIGGDILRQVVRKRHETVVTVLQELIDKIVAGGVTHPTTHYTDCLAYACRKLSAIVLDHLVWITTLLDRLLILPSTVASQVLYAIFPLMHVSPNIRENLILALRKALYRKGIPKRQMAVTGFLEMLKYSKMHSLAGLRLSQRCNTSGQTVSSSSTSTLTQVTLERNTQQMRSPMEYDKTLCFEILDILKKCFTYEYEVRLYLYEGLYETVIKNPEIKETVLDMLLTHFNVYFETDENILPPLKLDLCTDIHGLEVVLREPIAELIFVMQKIYTETTTKTSVIYDKLFSILESLSKRMASTDLEHLNLDDRTELLDDLPKSQQKLQNLKQAITIYEALMAFEIAKCSMDCDESACKIHDLFNGYSRLTDFIKQSTRSKKGDTTKGKKDKDGNNTTIKKTGKMGNVKLPNTVMDLDTIRKSLGLLYTQSSTEDEVVRLRENNQFHRYILQTCAQLLQRTKSLADDDIRLRNKQYTYVYIQIGRQLYKHPLSDLRNALTNDEQATILALECFKEICCSMCTTYSSELPRFLIAIRPSDSTTAEVDLQLQEIIFSFKADLKALLDEEENDTTKKVLSLLFDIIEQFISKINFEKYNSEKMFEWLKKMIQMENVQNSIGTVILQLLLRVEEYTQEYGETLNDICLELCVKLGTIDESELSISERYKIICEGMAVQIYNILNNCIKDKLTNAACLLVRLKAEDCILRASRSVEEVDEEKLREKERSLCRQLSHIIQMLHTLTNTRIEPGSCTDLTFKNLLQLYHLLGNLTKYFYAKSSAQNAAFQTVKFIQVVQLAGKPLKSAFYNLVTHVEEAQNKVHSKSDSHVQRNKVLKETKIIPRVVYEIEQFNKEVLLLGKKTGVSLENYMKHSITRDFRIKNPQLVEGLEKMDISMLITQNSTATDDETHTSADASDVTEDVTPSKKRPRIELSQTSQSSMF